MSQVNFDENQVPSWRCIQVQRKDKEKKERNPRLFVVSSMCPDINLSNPTFTFFFYLTQGGDERHYEGK